MASKSELIEASTDWTGIVHTDEAARVTSHRKVKGVLAIEVQAGSIRGAEVAGVFEVSDRREPLAVYKDGLTRVEVKCLWYGRKPPTSWMHLTLTGRWKLVQRYGGTVAENIGRSPPPITDE